MDAARRFQISDEPIDDVTHLVKLDGEGDFYVFPELKERLIQLIESGKKHFLVEISSLTLDGPPVLPLITRLVPADGSIALVSVEESVAHVFRLTRLDERFPVYSSVEDALAALRSPVKDEPAREGGQDVELRRGDEIPLENPSAGETTERWPCGHPRNQENTQSLERDYPGVTVCRECYTRAVLEHQRRRDRRRAIRQAILGVLEGALLAVQLIVILAFLGALLALVGWVLVDLVVPGDQGI